MLIFMHLYCKLNIVRNEKSRLSKNCSKFKILKGEFYMIGNILSHKQTLWFVVSMKDQYVKLTVVKFIKHENPFLMVKIGSTTDNSSNSMDVNILHTNSVFLSQSKIINQMLCIYFRIDISDKIISESIFQTKLFQN